MKTLFCALAMLGVMMTTELAEAKEVFSVDFSDKNWDRSPWDMVKSWRWPHMGEWVQEDNHIVNQVPLDATGVELEGKRVDKTYTSMILKEVFTGKTTFSCKMSFDYRMAPGVIITLEDPVKNDKGQWEYRDNLELILYNQGINVWHHYFVDGKQTWRLKAFLRAPYRAHRAYDYKVTVEQVNGKPQLTINCDGQILGYVEPEIRKNYRIGIVASEGANRFYDFKVWK